MEIFSALLALCARNSPVTGEFPSETPATRRFDVFFDLRLNKQLSKHSRYGDLRYHRAHYDVTVMHIHMFRVASIAPVWLRLLRWLRHQMETFPALLTHCAGNSPIIGEFPAQRPVTRSFEVFFDLRLNKSLSKQWWVWWFETLSPPLWRHANGNWINLQMWMHLNGNQTHSAKNTT